MANEVTVDGIVEDTLPGAKFKVRVSMGDNVFYVMAHLAGKMRVYNIRILPGDRVRLDLSAYDLTRGRIVYRYKANEAPEKASESNQDKPTEETSQESDS